MRFFLIVSIVFLQFVCTAQSVDSIVYNNDILVLEKCKTSDTYTLTNIKTNEKHKKIIFLKSLIINYQVLDANQNLYYLNDSGDRVDTVQSYGWMCGTVPHYTVNIEYNKDFFYVIQKETFFTRDGKESPDTITTLSKSDVDSLYFINGKQEFKYTSNYTFSNSPITRPETIIYKKGNQYGTIMGIGKTYDKIDFTYPVLTTYKNNLVGFYNIVEPKYQKISRFEYYLARCVKTNGTVVHIDKDGIEY